MKSLWSPRGVAVVGSGRFARQVVQYLRQHGYPGAIYPVEPAAPGGGAGSPEAFPSVVAVPGPVDLALVLVGAHRVIDVLQDCAAAGVAWVVVHASGFGEVGEHAHEQELAAYARSAGMRLVGPNCIGLVSPRDHLVAGFSPLFARVNFRPGNLGLVAQSGALGYGIASLAVERGLGFSRILNTGNEADLDSAEVVHGLLEDDATQAVLVYGEGLKRPLAWRELGALSIRRRKPVVMLKAGRSEEGARAAASHTAALAGDDAIWEAAFRQLGFLRVDDADEMLDLAAVFAQPRRAPGGRAGVLTTSGGAGILAADALARCGQTVPALTAQTTAELGAVVPRFGSTANPVDVTAQVISDSQLFRRALRAMAADPGLDLLLVCFCVLQGEEAERIAGDLLAVHAETTKPILVARTGAEFLAPGLAARLQQAGLPVYLTPGRAARAAGALVRFSGMTEPAAAARLAWPGAGESGTPGRPARVYTEPEAKALLAAEAGLPVTREVVVQSADDAVAAAEGLGYPVVMKIVSSTVHHKTEVDGVRLGVSTEAAVRQAFADLGAPCLVQEQVTGVVAEMLVGVSPSPMGPLVSVGLGGIFVEVLGDMARRLAPLTEAEALAMLEELRGFGLLAGARARPPGDVAGLARLVARLSRWAVQRPGGEWELDLNPVLVTPTGCTIADALLIERG
jgi:acetate---CoA ligase (ADP-forming)